MLDANITRLLLIVLCSGTKRLLSEVLSIAQTMAYEQFHSTHSQSTDIYS